MKIKPIPTKVRVFCTATERSVKALLVNRTKTQLKVELPTGCVLDLTLKPRTRNCYYFRICELEFMSDGILIN